MLVSSLPISLDPSDWANQFFTLLFQLFTNSLAGAFELILNSLGGEGGVYFFLVKLPIADVAAGGIGPAMVNVFEVIRNVSLAFFAVVLLVAGLSYALESFGVMREGTASGILTGSVFTLIVIFLTLPIYNAVAALFNVLTDPGSKLILEPGMIMSVLKTTISPPPVNAAQAFLNYIMAIFVFIIDLIALVAIAVLGALRIFFVGALVVMLPLLLILRLIPLTKGVAESLIEMLIGLMLSSVIAAIFLRFGFEVIQQWGGLLAMLAAFGTLVAAAMMPTVLAPRLGSVFSTTAGVITAGGTAATVIGGVSAVGAGTAGLSVIQTAGGIGNVFGPASTFAGTGLRAGLGNRVVGFTHGLRLMTPAMMKGGTSGFTQGTLAVSRGLRFDGTGFPRRVSLGSQVMGRQLQTIRDTASYDTARLQLEGTLASIAFKPIQGESAGHGWQYVNDITDLSDDRLSEKLADQMGQPSLAEDPHRTAESFRSFVDTLKQHPQLASRVSHHLDLFKERGSPPKETIARLNQNKSTFSDNLKNEVNHFRGQKRQKERTLRYQEYPSNTDALMNSLFKNKKAEPSTDE
ncbi:MAG: hypothetical protein M1503_03200 [Thaumarchaeota archaeon]|nr:hypothetical protein [Nitrososphaerota archaeon]MCL5317259.1 hypothetical protein [Nitrososphaerota archaeon]